MKAEILAQPEAWRRVVETVDGFLGRKSLPRPLSSAFLKRPRRAVVFGSGSSFHAALLARDYLSILASIPSRAAHASEVFQWEEPQPDGVLALALSHSGSSTDVRAAVRRAHRQGIATAAITNVDDSPIAREADAVLVTGAGAERAIPSTKGFTAAIAASFNFRLSRWRRAGTASPVDEITAQGGFTRGDVARSQGVGGRSGRVGRGAGASSVRGARRGWPPLSRGLRRRVEVSRGNLLAHSRFSSRRVPTRSDGRSARGICPRRARAGPERHAGFRNAVEGGDVLVVGSSIPGVRSLPLPRVDALVAPLVYAPALQLLAHAVGVRLDRPIDRPRYLQKIVS